MSKSKGLGDTVKKAARYLGLDKLAKEYEKATGKDCGCDDRQASLNRYFAYKGTMFQWEFEYLDSFFLNYNGSRLKSHDEKEMLYQISNRIFNRKETPSNCSSCLKNMINELKTEFDKYEKTGNN
tara:strand:+ start:3620 stop:3994 length:375 start_codon:yes stop_codon:yes gene_type:complete